MGKERLADNSYQTFYNICGSQDLLLSGLSGEKI
jgi:hypothetical protein